MNLSLFLRKVKTCLIDTVKSSKNVGIKTRYLVSIFIVISLFLGLFIGFSRPSSISCALLTSPSGITDSTDNKLQTGDELNHLPAAAPGSLAPVCVFYYGGYTSTARQQLLNTTPRYVVLNTPGGSYKGLISSPTPAEIAELKAAGITVLSYISLGCLVHFQYAWDSPPNDRDFVLGCIATVAAEGCDGIYFDEGGVGYRPAYADRYLEAPALDLYGNPNSWAGHTIEEIASYTHSFGMIAVLGTDYYETRFLNTNIFSIFDYVLTDENYYPRSSGESEIGYEAQCWVIGQDVYDADTAALYTNDALDRGFGAAYQCSSLRTLPGWYGTYISLLTSTTPATTTPPSAGNNQLNIIIQGQGTTSYGTGTINIPDNQQVSITAIPASGWVFRSWSWPGNSSSYAGWTENPASWTMTNDMNLIAIFDQVSVASQGSNPGPAAEPVTPSGPSTVTGSDTQGGSAPPSGGATIALPVISFPGPKVNGVEVTAITGSSANISWTTDELTLGQIEYLIDAPTLSSTEDSLALDHNITLTDLIPNTEYSFKIISCDQNQNSTKSDSFSFTTTGAMAEYAITEVRTFPRVIVSGENTTIIVTVKNNGESTGTCVLSPTIQGPENITVRTRSFEFEPGEKKSVEFPVTITQTGTYIISVDDVFITQTVKEISANTYDISNYDYVNELGNKLTDSESPGFDARNYSLYFQILTAISAQMLPGME